MQLLCFDCDISLPWSDTTKNVKEDLKKVLNWLLGAMFLSMTNGLFA